MHLPTLNSPKAAERTPDAPSRDAPLAQEMSTAQGRWHTACRSTGSFAWMWSNEGTTRSDAAWRAVRADCQQTCPQEEWISRGRLVPVLPDHEVMVVPSGHLSRPLL